MGSLVWREGQGVKARKGSNALSPGLPQSDLVLCSNIESRRARRAVPLQRRTTRQITLIGASPNVFLFRGENYDLAFFAGAFARSADAGFFLQDEMQDAPFSSGHGIESKWSVRFANAFGGDASGKL
jgi:hypothetical protein